MLLAVALILLATGLPAYAVLMGVSVFFVYVGALAGVVDLNLMKALPSRIIGLFETDLLQALPLYVLMGALVYRLPLSEHLFRCAMALGGKTVASPAVTTLGLGTLFAPMSGSVGASVAMLCRSVAPRLQEHSMAPAQATALVCVASTLGVVIPPSLVLILLGDAMMRAHTEATNLTHQMVRIVNTQDIFRGALIPAALFLVLSMLVCAWMGRGQSLVTRPQRPSATQWMSAIGSAALVVGLLCGVTLGYFYAVEAAAVGSLALLLYGLLSGHLNRGVLGEVLLDTMALSGALFALFVAATTFTLVFRSFGTDHLLDQWVRMVPGGATGAAVTVLVVFALSAFVLDAFEIVFVIVPIIMPPVLAQAGDAVWISVLALLALQLSFILPPSGYAVMLSRGQMRNKVSMSALARALAPFIAVLCTVLVAVVAFPRLVTLAQPARAQESPIQPNLSDEEIRKKFDEMLNPPASQ